MIHCGTDLWSHKSWILHRHRPQSGVDGILLVLVEDWSAKLTKLVVLCASRGCYSRPLETARFCCKDSGLSFHIAFPHEKT